MTRSSRDVSLNIGLASLLAVAVGCKGCDDAAVPRPRVQAEPDPARATLEELQQRGASLGVDLTKTYPKGAGGVVECGADRECFVVMAERCEPARFDQSLRDPSGLAIKRIDARYRLSGRQGGDCIAHRLVVSIELELPEDGRAELRKRGLDELAIAALHVESLALLKQAMPERVLCAFPGHRALEAALDVFEGKDASPHFSESCEEIGEGEPWPEDLRAPAQEEGAPAPANPAAPEDPAAGAAPAGAVTTP